MESMQWEIDWVRNNFNQYDSKQHSESVVQNIIKKYYIKQLEKSNDDLVGKINKMLLRNQRRYERI